MWSRASPRIRTRLHSPDRNSELPDGTCAGAVFKVDPAFAERVQPYRYGTGGARVMAMELINQQGEPAVAFRFNEWITVRAYIECYKEIDFLNCCILIRNRNGIEITHATSFESGFAFPVLKAGDRIVVDIRFRNILKGGEGIHDPLYREQYPADGDTGNSGFD